MHICFTTQSALHVRPLPLVRSFQRAQG